ncbi:MAG: arsenate reductase (glutaredoxin) [Phenylobacterium sp.]|uniref:arsenate reductase (glutaredoxin) n=1 Tax=Phenylobacterium sp. TaxID=1871053 RepID=UPI00271CB88C|nr:arsenate reductase (glutaredoxin) [Phenylobacterium sp.]MDO8902220.1 arsenate reductase (glutaredoxin) [Phenylobacterium sp.]
MSRPDVVIYHNPACGTSRDTLALLRDKGVEPTVVEYLKVGWTKEQLQDLAERSEGGIRGLLRDRGSRAAELGLTDPATSEEAILAAMILDPALVNRPIVATAKGAALCRPAERVVHLL